MHLLSNNPALRSHLESQIDFMNEFSQKTYDLLRKLSEIHLKLARQTIDGAIHASREMLGCADPAQFAQATMRQLEPATERMRVYQQQLLSVLADAQAECTRAAEIRVPEAARAAGVGDMARHAGANVPVTTGPTTANATRAPVSPYAGDGSAEGQPHLS